MTSTLSHLRLARSLAHALCLLCACAPDLSGDPSAPLPSATEDFDAEDGSGLMEKRQSLSNATTCFGTDVGRIEVTYPRGFGGNMQYYSLDAIPELSEWWARQDGCPAYVVQWRRNPPRGDVNEAAFVAAIHDPRITGIDPANCPLIWVSKWIAARPNWEQWGTQWINLEIDTEEQAQDFGPNACGYEFNRIAWFGPIGPAAKWLEMADEMRAIVQGWFWVFPLPVSAYMQSDTPNNSCPTECCADGFGDPPDRPAGWCRRH